MMRAAFGDQGLALDPLGPEAPDPHTRRRSRTAGPGGVQGQSPWSPKALFLLLLLFLAACAGRRDQAEALATSTGFQRLVFETGSFGLVGYLKGAGPRLTVYIEGDGLAWISRTRLSDDPTPRQPLALELATRDPGPAVLYLARPCQYTNPAAGRPCPPAYWSSHRFAPEVIAAVGRALDEARRRTGASRLVLVGYSGGGAVAALTAAGREDVVALATVAAPLDHAAWTRHHRVDPLTGSLNPADSATRLSALPQIHFAGARDEIVPPAVIAAFLSREGPDASRRLYTSAEADHHCCWLRLWPQLRPLIPDGS